LPAFDADPFADTAASDPSGLDPASDPGSGAAPLDDIDFGED
jgi:hypothetical protein